MKKADENIIKVACSNWYQQLHMIALISVQVKVTLHA